MHEPKNPRGLGLIFVIVDEGMGSKVFQASRRSSFAAGTILLGKGTCRRGWLDSICLGDTRKEILILAVDDEDEKSIFSDLGRMCRFNEAGGGIAFLMRMSSATGFSKPSEAGGGVSKGGARGMYRLISVIVKRGLAEEVMDAAASAGAKGGTIINARGTGVGEVLKLFRSMEIEPEKEMVMILVREDIALAVASSIRSRMEIDKPGTGIMFIQDVETAYGMVE